MQGEIPYGSPVCAGIDLDTMLSSILVGGFPRVCGDRPMKIRYENARF